MTVDDGDTERWPVQPAGSLLENPSLSNTSWKRVLGQLWFGLDEADEPGSPSFRSLVSYFVRREHGGGFLSPTQHFRNQRVGNQRIAISYLMGLDWEVARDLEDTRAREEAVRSSRASETAGLSDLRTDFALAGEAARRAQISVQSFRLLPTYSEVQLEADRLTVSINDLSELNSVDRRLADRMAESLQAEQPPSIADVESVYREVGVVLPDRALRRFEDVRRFHDSVVENRRAYLEAERQAAESRMSERNQELERLDGQRARALETLHGHGALEQLQALQAEAARREADRQYLEREFERLAALDLELGHIEAEKAQLSLRLRQTFQEQEETLSQAILAFEAASGFLYEEGGNLRIEATPSGPRFDVVIRGGNSRGVTNMQIFCFDMMLMAMAQAHGIGPGFLVHDSHLFDGVDERQVARALQYAEQQSESLGYQYIATLNSDVLHNVEQSGYSPSHAVLPVRLTDRGEDGGLFGIRF